METKWMRFLEMSAQAFVLTNIWRSASAMVVNGAMTEPLGLLQALEPFAIPAAVLAVISSVAAVQIRLRGQRKLRKALHKERPEPVSSAHELPSLIYHNEQLIAELQNQVRELNKEKERLIHLLQEKSARLRQDPLTGVSNRLAYEEQLHQEFQRWKRFGNPLTFLIWDIDHFKQINDRHGHDIGDEVLREVARQLNSRLRSTDFVARYGGEEFAMLLPGADIEAALQLAEQIRHHIAESGFRYGEAHIPVTISCGLASFQPGDCLESVFKRADQALYQAKKTGRNSCWVS
ncbi:MAG: GGDEF domain-containing protein [Gammaproteobacteria bacterium]|nr:GGDEF domain-containing protein [Gammaproteobacteria bacterium]